MTADEKVPLARLLRTEAHRGQSSMKRFTLPPQTPVKVLSVNVRSEKFGQKLVPAVDLKLELTDSNHVLEQLKPGLREALYVAVGHAEEPPQGELDGVERISDLPLLRVAGLAPVHISDELTGYTVTVDLGLGKRESMVELSGCKVNTFSVEALQGGSVKVGFRVQASNLKEREIGKLGILIGTEVSVELEPPLVTDPIDGTVPPTGETPTNTKADAEADTDFRRHGRDRKTPVSKKIVAHANREAAAKKKVRR